MSSQAQSISSSKSQSSHSSGSSHHKFSSIVNKVESLINKMNNDKFNNFKLLQSNALLPARKLTVEIEHGVRSSVSSTFQSEECALSSCVECTSQQNQQVLETFDDTLTRTASLDSLNQLTDAEDAFDNQDLIYTDSDDAEIAHITGTTAVQVHRRSDLDQLTDETIREFNEQCSSLSHDVDFENTWSAEDDEEKCWTQASDDKGYCDDSDSQKNVNETFGKIYRYETIGNRSDSNKSDGNINLNFREIAKYQRDANNNNKRDIVPRINESSESTWSSIKQKQQNCQDNESEFAQQSNTNGSVANGSENTEACHDQYNPENGYENALLITTDVNISNNDTNNGNIKNSNNQQQISTKRRPSLASSGSVGRMETILEEPGECKVSVKEILARFETMSLTEVKLVSATICYF